MCTPVGPNSLARQSTWRPPRRCPVPFPVSPFRGKHCSGGFLPGVVLPVLELPIIGSTHCGLIHSTKCFWDSPRFFSLLSDIPWHESHSLVICSPVCRLLGCFQFWAIANRAAMNTLYRSFYGHVLPFLLGKYIGMELLGQKYVSFYKKRPFPQVAVLFCFPTDNVGRFQQHQHLYCQSFSVWAILVGVQQCHLVVLNHSLLKLNDDE